MSWLSRQRGRRERSRLLGTLGSCDQCGHAWADHPGAWPHLTDVCDECGFEVDHGQRGDEPACTTPCPLMTVAQVQALQKLWSEVPGGAGAPISQEESAHDVLDSWFAGVLSSHQANPDGMDALRRLILDPGTPQAVRALAQTAHHICTRPTDVS